MEVGEVILSILLPLIFGSYAFTFWLWSQIKELFKKVFTLEANHLPHLADDVAELRNRIERLESGYGSGSH